MSRRRTNVEEFDPKRVRPLPGQPRKRFRGIKELADSIFECGQQSPGIVTLVEGDPKFDAQLVDGERRLRACQMVNVPFRAEVRPAADAEATFIASFAANFGKQDHDVIEIAEGLDRIHRTGKTMVQMGRIAGRSMCWVVQHLNLLKLHPDVRAMMIPAGDDQDEQPRLTFAIAQLLVPVPHGQQVALAKLITRGDGLSISEARRVVLRARAERGDTSAYLGGDGPKRTLATIQSIVRELSSRIGVYLDMPGPDINRLIDAADAKTKQKLLDAMEEGASDLTALADAVRKRLPVTRVGERVGV
jgi:ParB/RepB/Spo0J family partition protein